MDFIKLIEQKAREGTRMSLEMAKSTVGFFFDLSETGLNHAQKGLADVRKVYKEGIEQAEKIMGDEQQPTSDCSGPSETPKQPFPSVGQRTDTENQTN